MTWHPAEGDYCFVCGELCGSEARPGVVRQGLVLCRVCLLALSEQMASEACRRIREDLRMRPDGLDPEPIIVPSTWCLRPGVILWRKRDGLAARLALAGARVGVDG